MYIIIINKVCELLETMISELRLDAQIDQVEGYIYFKVEQNNNIEHFCTNLYNVAQKVWYICIISWY